MKKASNTDSYLHILKYISLFGGVQVINVLVGIVRNKFVAMLLGPQGVGLISLFNSTTKLISDSTNFGISMSAVRNLSEDYDQNDEEKLTEDIAVVRSWDSLSVSSLVRCLAVTPFRGTATCFISSFYLLAWH